MPPIAGRLPRWPPSMAIVSALSTSSIQPPCHGPSGAKSPPRSYGVSLLSWGWMPGAVVALAVVLGDEFPVRVDLVGDLVGDPERPEVEPPEMRDEIAQPRRRARRRLRVEADEDEPLPGRQSWTATRPKPSKLKSSRSSVCFARMSLPVEVVDPGVVRALEPDGRAARLLDDGRAAMPADVVERAQDVVPSADDHEWLVVDRGPGSRCPGAPRVLLASDHHPVAPEPLASFELVDRRVVVRPAGQQRGGPVGLANGGDLGLGERRRDDVASGQGSDLRMRRLDASLRRAVERMPGCRAGQPADEPDAGSPERDVLLRVEERDRSARGRPRAPRRALRSRAACRRRPARSGPRRSRCSSRAGATRSGR